MSQSRTGRAKFPVSSSSVLILAYESIGYESIGIYRGWRRNMKTTVNRSNQVYIQFLFWNMVQEQRILSACVSKKTRQESCDPSFLKKKKKNTQNFSGNVILCASQV